LHRLQGWCTVNFVSSIRPGATLHGKFMIEHVLGEGGTGTVYQAFHLRMKTRVAIKVLDRLHAANRVSVGRFEREARAAARMRGAHAVKVYDVDTTDDGIPFMVMDRLYGQELSKALRDASIPVATAVDWTIQICSAIQEAHDLGIIHRDLKPANIFLVEPDEVVKIVDFGISKHSDSAELTAESEVLGTPRYMAPEQLRGEAVCPQTDIWAIGIILYRMLTGRHAFFAPKGAAPFVAATATLVNDPVPIRHRLPDLPVGLAEAVTRCLRKPAPERWPSARKLAEAITPFGSGAITFEEVEPLPNRDASLPLGGIEVPPTAGDVRDSASSIPTALAAPRDGASRPDSESHDGFAEWPAPPRPRFAGRWPWLLGIAGVIGAVAVSAWFALQSSSRGTGSVAGNDEPKSPVSAPSPPSMSSAGSEGPVVQDSKEAAATAPTSSGAPSARPPRTRPAAPPTHRSPSQLPASDEHPAKSTPLYL